jgi:hypothetical protein
MLDDNQFGNLLKKYGICLPNVPAANEGQHQKSPSSLRLYQCSCGVKVRVGRTRFNAQCLDCGTSFMFQEKPLKTHNNANKKKL